jgi:phosphopantetheine--protein transferase-like protein
MIGIDVVDIARFQRIYQDKALLFALFTDDEIIYLRSRQFPEASAAGMFAAKEAYCKAIQRPLTLSAIKNIEIEHASDGRPILQADQTSTCFSTKHPHLSISHTQGVALAVVALQ